MKKRMEMWIARDKDDTLTIFVNKPQKNYGSWTAKGNQMFIDENLFKEIKWEEDNPRKVELHF